MAFYVGIDGGGTKTESVLGDAERMLARATAASSKIQVVGEEAARAALQAAIQGACASANIDPKQLAGVCIGISGYSRADVGPRLAAMVAEIAPAVVQVVGDNTIAMEAAFGTGPGVLVIAGTGSIAFARNQRGEQARAGGWGPAISDEGSGAWIGRSAVTLMMRAADRGKPSLLERAILRAWQVQTREEVATVANRQPPPDFAALFPLVLQAARRHDAPDRTAAVLLGLAGSELATLAHDVIERLWPEPGGRPVPVRLTGGVFASAEEVRLSFSELLRSMRADAEINLEVVEPALGALTMARRLRREGAGA